MKIPKIKKRYIAIAGILITIIATYSRTVTLSKNFMVLESLFGDDSMFKQYEVQVEEPPEIPEYSGTFFNKYHEMAVGLDLDFIRTHETEILKKFKSNNYNLKIANISDLVGNIESYNLICEILIRPEINPTDSKFKIQPYHLYGTWWNETGMYRDLVNTKYSPYTAILKEYSSDSFKGPFQIYKSLNGIGVEPFTSLASRPYLYISTQEQKDCSNRVIRCLSTELSDISPDTCITGMVTTGYESPTSEELSEIRSKLKFHSDSRPDVEFLPDATYTTIRKLRDCYNGYDIHTLNKTTVPQTEYIESNIQKYLPVELRSVEVTSDLYYLYALLLNSSKLSEHSYSEDILSTKGEDLSFMPRVYFSMLSTFGTLDIRDLGLINSWSEQPLSDDAMFGQDFYKIDHLYNMNITRSNNLIDLLADHPNKFTDENLRSELYKVSRNLNNKELEISLSYGLRAITNGKMIEQGIEEAIELCYDFQNEATSKSEESSPKATKLEDVTLSYPLYDPNGGKLDITQGFSWNPLVSIVYIPGVKGHNGVDMNIKRNGYTSSTSEVHSVYDGVIVTLVNWYLPTQTGKSLGYGNHIIIKHTVGEQSFFTIYAHMSKVNSNLHIGSKVSKGESLGIIGTTGYSTGIHLHMGMYTVNAKTNQKKYYNFLDYTDKEEIG